MDIHGRRRRGKPQVSQLCRLRRRKGCRARGDRAGAGGPFAGNDHRFRASHTAAHEGASAPHWWSINDTKNSTGIAPNPSNTRTQPSPRSLRSRSSSRFVIILPATRGSGQPTRSAGPLSLPPGLVSAGVHARRWRLRDRLDDVATKPPTPSTLLDGLDLSQQLSLTGRRSCRVLRRRRIRWLSCCLCRRPINAGQRVPNCEAASHFAHR